MVRWSCEFDEERFVRETRIPLFRDQWNVWEVWLTDLYDETEEEIEERVRMLLAWWLWPWVETGPRKSWPGAPGGHLTFRDAEQIGIEAKRVPPEIAPLAARADRVTIPGATTPEGRITYRHKEGGGMFPVSIRFVYRGDTESIPWPVATGIVPIWDEAGEVLLDHMWCPVDTDAVVAKVFEPPDWPVPEPNDLWDDFADEYPEAAESIANIAHRGAEALASVGRGAVSAAKGVVFGALAAGLGLVLLSNAVKRR